MEALSNLTCKPPPQPHFSLPRFPNLHRRRHLHHCPSFSKSVFFKTPLSSSAFSIKASISDSHSSSSSSSLFSFLKLPISIAAISAALVVSRLSPFRPLPALAEAPVVETISEEKQNDAVPENSVKEDEKEVALEKLLQGKLASNPNDVESLKSLLELKMRMRQLQEVVEISSKLSDLEPEEVEWSLLRGHSYCYLGDHDSAKRIFEEILSKDPNTVEAYHGLVMSASQLDVDDGKELDEVERRIHDAIQRLKKENNTEEATDFYLLIAQIRFIKGDYLAALNVYQDMVREEPKDYRPYLCQGIIYTLLRKKKEAEEQFENYRRLVPKEHPFADYLDHNVKNTTKVFSEAVQK